MSTGHRWRIERAASDLAAFLRAAKEHILAEQLHACDACGRLFRWRRGARRCARCREEHL